MDSDKLRELLEAVRRGETDIESAIDRLAELPFIDTANSRVDTHRALRQGIPEVVYGGEKTSEQIVEAARARPVCATGLRDQTTEQDDHPDVDRRLPFGRATNERVPRSN